MQREKVHGAGKSSFGLVDHTKVFNELRLRRGITFLDLGCGRGEYAIAASKIVGDNGLVYGIDLWEDGIAFHPVRRLPAGWRPKKLRRK